MLHAGRCVAIPALLMAAATPVPAASRTIADQASELTYDLCPLFLNDELSLTGRELKERGFGSKVEGVFNKRFGEIRMVTAKLPDGNVSFGGTSQTLCQVIVEGSNAEMIVARVKQDMRLLNVNWQLDPANSGKRGTATVETYRAPPKSGAVLHLQLAAVSLGERPTAIVQLFALEE